jgi:hypothetical protein
MLGVGGRAISKKYGQVPSAFSKSSRERKKNCREKKKKKAHSKRCAKAVAVRLAPADGVVGKILFVTWIHKLPTSTDGAGCGRALDNL